MYSKLRSLIFKIDPELAHSLAIKSLKLNFSTNIFDENKNDPMFQTILFGKKIKTIVFFQKIIILKKELDRKIQN